MLSGHGLTIATDACVAPVAPVAALTAYRVAIADLGGGGRRPLRKGRVVRSGETPRPTGGSRMSSTQQTGVSVIEQLASYAAGESFEKLPEAAVRAARRAILDTLGVTLAGSVEVTAERARALVAHRRGGSDEATIIGSALRASVEDAALANGTAAHALDYDDLHQSLSGHPSVP